MAFIQRLPRRDMFMQEQHYGSKLHLRINPNTQCCDGTYEPVSTRDVEFAVPGAESEEKQTDGSGHAVLYGRVQPEPGSNNLILKGEWRHVEGPLKGGTFEMKLADDYGAASGWWAEEGQDVPNDWNWSPSDPDIIERLHSKAGNEDEHVTQTQPSRMRRSLSSRVNRASTFFDEVLEAEGAASLRIARWGVLCGWIFFYQTSAALIMTILKFAGTPSSLLQCGFQAVYTSTYLSFLVIYSRMRILPPADYVAGVFLYTVGYACFLVLYALVLLMGDDESAGHACQVLYVVGALLFLNGSAVLVRATLPPPIPMLMRELGFLESLRERFSLIDQQSSLFWGSVNFLLGSVLFSLDAGWSLFHAESKPEMLSLVCGVVGYAFFTIGRVYFLWGSTTQDCGAFFGNSNSNLCSCAKALVLKFFRSQERNFSQITPSVENNSQPAIDEAPKSSGSPANYFKNLYSCTN